MGQLEAYGVEYSRHGLLQQVFVRKEVILSAGALMSPHILMHSGIGPEDELRKHGVREMSLMLCSEQQEIIMDNYDFSIYRLK